MDDERDDLELDVEESNEAPESEELDEQENDPDESEPEDEEERVVTIGDEQIDEPETPGWVKKVRKVNRKLESENKRLKRELELRSTASQAPPPVLPGEKPTLKSVGYDDKKYEIALAEYFERKRRADQYEAEKAKQIQGQQQRWQERQQRYVTQKSTHGFKDYSDAEELVTNTLNITQQGIIVQGAEDSALLVYALGKNPKKLEEFAKIDDPVDFAFRIAKLESQLKVTKKAPDPERRVVGAKTGGLSGSEDKVLERLRDEAQRTGDYTKVAQYKRKKRGK
jgi:hypothetical protein